MSNQNQQSAPSPSQVMRQIATAKAKGKLAADALKLRSVAEVRKVVHTSEG